MQEVSKVTADTSYLETLALFEERVGDIYRILSTRFADESGAPEFWQALSSDEEAHAAQVRGLDPARYAAGLEHLAATDHFRLDVTLDQLARIAEHVREAAIALPAAISMAYGLECSMAERHALLKPQGRGPAVAELLEALLLADKAHLERISEYAARYQVYLPGED